MRRLVWIVLSLLLWPQLAAAQSAARCAGTDLLARMETADPAAHAALFRRAHAAANARGKFWRVSRDGVPPSYLFGTFHDTGIARQPLDPAVARALFGVSGPAALDASRHWLHHPGSTVTVNLLPGRDLAATEQSLMDLAKNEPRAQLRNALTRLLPNRLAAAVVGHLELDGSTRMATLTREVRRRLARSLLAWPLPVLESRGYRYAEVTAGGVPLAEIDPATLGSRRCPGLHLAGEILDVDGRIGGFNFQWAWSSGWVAAAGVTGTRA